MPENRSNWPLSSVFSVRNMGFLHDIAGVKVGLDTFWPEFSPVLESEEYRKFVKTVKVVNDAAERGIKLASDDVQSLTKDSDIRQNIFQTVERHRMEKPDTKKSTANK